VANNVQPAAVWTLYPYHVVDKDSDVLLFDIERQIGPPIGPDQFESPDGVSDLGISPSGGAKCYHHPTQRYCSL
jgi:hypothetical protein